MRGKRQRQDSMRKESSGGGKRERRRAHRGPSVASPCESTWGLWTGACLELAEDLCCELIRELAAGRGRRDQELQRELLKQQSSPKDSYRGAR